MSSAGESSDRAGPRSVSSERAEPADHASSPPPDLTVPAEPVELRHLLRSALLAGEGWEARFGPELGVGEALWPVWGEALSAAGMTREQFTATVRGYRRELWFWVLGDRIWAQAASGLAGRLRRRVPSAPTTT